MNWIDALQGLALLVGLVGLWLAMIFKEPTAPKRNHRSSDLLGGKEL